MKQENCFLSLGNETGEKINFIQSQCCVPGELVLLNQYNFNLVRNNFKLVQFISSPVAVYILTDVFVVPKECWPFLVMILCGFFL